MQSTTSRTTLATIGRWLSLLIVVGLVFAHQCQAFTISNGSHPLWYQMKQPIATASRLFVQTSSSDCFAVRMNEFFKKPVPQRIKEAISIFEETEETKLDGDVVTLLTAAPGKPGVPRPLWLVVLGSIPSGLLWYGYYKFAVEEELFQIEVDSGVEPRGYGGYGTLGPFTYGMFLGPLAALLDLPGGINWSGIGIAWIYYTQFLLYDRVNQLYREEGLEEPLNVWWCIPLFFPFNLVVGLRQVHFLSQYFYRQRGFSTTPKDPVADFFPFVSAPPFTWQEFFLTPSLWCSLLSDTEKVDIKALPEPLQKLLEIGTSKK